jgi:transcriptional regulator with XRE-family HTH domain
MSHRTVTIDRLLEESDLPLEEIADRAGVTADRLRAIATGRWTPSPAERQRVAAALAVEVEHVSWGHSMAPRNIRYHRFGMKEGF